MRPEAKFPTCPDEAALMLPWYVNGTLSAGDARRVAAHLEHCGACRADVEEQRRLDGLMRAPTPVDYAPQAGWRRLQARIDAAGQAELPAARHAVWRPRSRPVAWLAAAVVVQSIALAAIAGAGLLGWATTAPSYRTLTSTPADHGLRLRVVFAPATTLGELSELLHANQLAAIAGPSDAGLFTLAMPASDAGDGAAVLARLRADPRVRFADLLGADTGSR